METLVRHIILGALCYHGWQEFAAKRILSPENFWYSAFYYTCMVGCLIQVLFAFWWVVKPIFTREE